MSDLLLRLRQAGAENPKLQFLLQCHKMIKLLYKHIQQSPDFLFQEKNNYILQGYFIAWKKRSFYQEKCKKLHFGDFTRAICEVGHMSACPVTEKNVTNTMVSMCFAKKLT